MEAGVLPIWPRIMLERWRGGPGPGSPWRPQHPQWRWQWMGLGPEQRAASGCAGTGLGMALLVQGGGGVWWSWDVLLSVPCSWATWGEEGEQEGAWALAGAGGLAP